VEDFSLQVKKNASHKNTLVCKEVALQLTLGEGVLPLQNTFYIGGKNEKRE
jgi:hypothetical protein